MLLSYCHFWFWGAFCWNYYSFKQNRGILSIEGLNPCSHMQQIGAVFLNVMMSGVTGFTFLYHETQVNTPKTFVVYSFLSFICLKKTCHIYLFLVAYHVISEQVLYLVPTSCVLFLTTAGGQGSISCTQQLCELLTRTAWCRQGHQGRGRFQ